ncbi:uncharacterized protein DS421_13g440960 [Arachis hypogaea]|nr:uncharacterized protein DS421_13g440960 [Arachis hypogaea]
MAATMIPQGSREEHQDEGRMVITVANLDEWQHGFSKQKMDNHIIRTVVMVCADFMGSHSSSDEGVNLLGRNDGAIVVTCDSEYLVLCLHKVVLVAVMRACDRDTAPSREGGTKGLAFVQGMWRARLNVGPIGLVGGEAVNGARTPISGDGDCVEFRIEYAGVVCSGERESHGVTAKPVYAELESVGGAENNIATKEIALGMQTHSNEKMTMMLVEVGTDAHTNGDDAAGDSD